jgi:hypothetical protein
MYRPECADLTVSDLSRLGQQSAFSGRIAHSIAAVPRHFLPFAA